MLRLVICCAAVGGQQATRHLVSFEPLLHPNNPPRASELAAVVTAHATRQPDGGYRLGRAGVGAMLAAVKKAVPLQERRVFSTLGDGFSADLSSEQVAALRALGLSVDSNTEVRMKQGGDMSWALDRLDQRSLPLSRSAAWSQTGEGVDVYVLDTGINTAHAEFAGRLGSGCKDFVGDGNGYEDCQGHGTHCAGSCCGATVGVAKRATIHALRVLDCDGRGYSDDIFAAMDWIVEHDNNEGQPAGAAPRRKVASMSLGGGYSAVQNAYVDRMHQANISVVVAAGNDATDACSASPASAFSAITVGSTSSNDHASTFSNYGSCVDIFAPGSDIKSASHESANGFVFMSGTSMACPHVAGIAALALQAQPSLSSDAVRSRIVSMGIDGVVTATVNGNNEPNLMAHISSSALDHPNDGTDYVPVEMPQAEQQPATDDESNIFATFLKSLWHWLTGHGWTVQQSASVTHASNCGDIRVQIRPDSRSFETSWKVVREADDTVVMHGDFNDGRHDVTQCLPYGKYIFSIFDAGGNGICCAHGNGRVILSMNGNEVARISDEFWWSDSVQILVSAKPALPTRDVHVRITPDVHQQDNSWYVLDEDGTVVMEGGFESGEEALLPGAYTLEMYDAHGDGMGQGKYEVLVDDKLVLSGGAFSGLVERRSFVVQPRTEPECYTRADGSDYRGSAHTTKDGLTCQRWTEHSPHSHSFSSDAYPDAGLGAHNFCRNPDHSSHAWCFTTSAQTERAPCVLQPPQASCTEDVPSAEMLHMEKPIGARAAQGKTPHLLPLLSLTSGMLFVAAAFRSRRKAERVSEMHVDELL